MYELKNDGQKQRIFFVWRPNAAANVHVRQRCMQNDAQHHCYGPYRIQSMVATIGWVIASHLDTHIDDCSGQDELSPFLLLLCRIVRYVVYCCIAPCGTLLRDWTKLRSLSQAARFFCCNVKDDLWDIVFVPWVWGCDYGYLTFWASQTYSLPVSAIVIENGENKR